MDKSDSVFRARLQRDRVRTSWWWGQANSPTVPLIPYTRTMCQTPPIISPSSAYQAIFDSALETYRKRTKEDLCSHPLFAQLESCHSLEAILTVLREQLPGFDQPGSSNDRFTKCLNPIVNILFTLSATIGGGISLVSVITSFLGDSTIWYPFCRYTHQRVSSSRALAFFFPWVSSLILLHGLLWCLILSDR